MDLALYVVFFLPAVLAFMYAGWNYAQMSIRFRDAGNGNRTLDYEVTIKALPDTPLVVAVPVSVKTHDQRNELGNHLVGHAGNGDVHAPLVRELDGVRRKVHQHLAQLVDVGHQPDRLRRCRRHQ